MQHAKHVFAGILTLQLLAAALMSTCGHIPVISVNGLVQTVTPAVWNIIHRHQNTTFLLGLPLGAAIKMASFIVQLAQDHVVLEEKLVSHTKSAEINQNM